MKLWTGLQLYSFQYVYNTFYVDFVIQVRIYTPKSVFQELEVAKEEYIHNNFKIQKGQKMLLPKLVDLYAKDSGLCHTGLMDMIEHSVPDSYQKSFHLIRKGKFLKKIEWATHDFTFRYLLSPDLAKF